MRSTSRLRLVGALVALCAPAVAQSLTVPQSMNGVEGAGGSSIPFGTNTPGRLMCIYDPEELPWTGPRVITAIAFRADNPVPGTTSYAAIQYVTCSLIIGTTSRRAADASTTFDNNFDSIGSDATQVVTNLRLQLPAQPATNGVRAANIVIPFTLPFVYGSSPVHGQNPPSAGLIFDLLIVSQPGPASGQQYRLDGIGSCSSSVQTFGQGLNCLANRNGGAAGNLLDLEPGASMLAGAAYAYTLTGMPPNTPFLVNVSGRLQGTFFGQPVPFALFDPNNPNLPPPNTPLLYSAPDCWINLPLAVGLSGASDANGTGVVSINLPPGRNLLGQSLFAQAMVYDQTANPLQVVTSLGKSSTICGPLGVTRIYQSYPLNGTPPTVGSVAVGACAIIEVQ